MSEPTIQTKIWEALKAQVESAAAVVSLPVSYPAENYSPDIANGFIIANNHMNPSDRIAMGNDETHIYTGILHLDVMLPILNDPNYRSPHVYAMQIAGTVVAQFPESLKMVFRDVTVQPTKLGDVSAGYRDGSMWRVPVLIRWRAVG